MKTFNSYTLYRICDNNGYCTSGSYSQYNKLLDLNAAGAAVDDLALVIWLCSDGFELADVKRHLRSAYALLNNDLMFK